MTLLHVHFNLRNQQAFQRLLESTGIRGQPSTSSLASLSTSGGKSWSRSTAPSSILTTDVNARDWLGRTVLQMACASVEPSSLQYVRLLLAHPAINVNLQDAESNWTALHRALYAGNLAAAILLLKRSDVDTSLKDLEGYTAFDLYNTTLRTTKPNATDEGPAELFTWGANRNAALGLGDGDNRTFPDQVIIPRKHDPNLHDKTLEVRFSPIQVRQVSMSRLHTVVVTSEIQDNLRLCGFGSGGRLGPSQHTQYGLMTLPEFSHNIVSVALGQDHTLALTKSWEVLSWGLNRFSQLGYVVDQSPMSVGRREEPIQASPRKIGHLKKETVRGIAACKTASACWTETEVFTWGTNSGQLGYSKNATPVQVLPRKVTVVVQPVTAIAMTDNAMACLLKSGDVAFLWNDIVLKINFPTQSFSSEIHVYRPPQAIKGPKVAKITSCEDTFAALSSNGEVFIFTPPGSSDDGPHGKGAATVIPQRVWALRKQFSGVRDVDLGADGSIIVCTFSGHVFVRIRNPKGGQSSSAKTFKFQRVPYIQRAIKVCANSTGAFGALRVDFRPQPIRLSGRTFAQDMADVQPYLSWLTNDGHSAGLSSVPFSSPCESGFMPIVDIDDEVEDVPILDDIAELSRFLNLIKREKIIRKSPGSNLYDYENLPHGADLLVRISTGVEFPVHRIVLSARCPVLCSILSSTGTVQDTVSKVSVRSRDHNTAPGKPDSLFRLVFAGCGALSVLILLRYLYCDELLAIWDRRIGLPFDTQLRDLNVYPTQVKTELQILARILELPHLTQALESLAKRIPVSSLIDDHSRLFTNADKSITKALPPPDVILQLADEEISCYSAILRARSPFFTTFFGDNVWTIKRRDEFGVVVINMKHLKWRVMEYILRFLCCGEEGAMFETIDSLHTVDHVMEFMFEVMAAASELLLDRMILHCSAVILKHLNINNVCFLLADATYFHAVDLVESLQGYMAANLETLLECGMLDDLSPDLITQFSKFLRKQQARKSFLSRSNKLANEALKKHHDWLAEQDVPEPIVPVLRKSQIHRSPKLSPAGLTRKGIRPSIAGSPSTSPSLHPRSGPRPVPNVGPIGDEIFSMDAMDDADAIPALDLSQAFALLESDASHARPVVWKRGVSTRVDLKTIMAETENSKITPKNTVLTTPGLDRTTQRPAITASRSNTSGTSPWKLPIPPSTPTKHPSPTSTPLGTPSSAQMKAPDTRRMMTQPSTPSPSRSTATLKTQQAQLGLGPMITPARASPAKPGPSTTRRVSSNGGAWTLPPVKPVVEPTVPGSALPFAEIQRLQLEQGNAGTQEKRSLLEIQEEEQSRQREEEFMKWWEAEEERVRLESQPTAQPARRDKSSKKNGKSKGKRTQGSSETQPNQRKSNQSKPPTK